MLIVYKRELKESICLGTAENFQIWLAVLTYDQPKVSSVSDILSYD
jgi:hypothetical protein